MGVGVALGVVVADAVAVAVPVAVGVAVHVGVTVGTGVWAPKIVVLSVAVIGIVPVPATHTVLVITVPAGIDEKVPNPSSSTRTPSDATFTKAQVTSRLSAS